jgi:hypothetical protein
MWYIAGACVVMALTAAAGFAGVKTFSAFKTGAVASFIKSASVKSLSMRQVNWLLARLENLPAPDPVMGAMCYEPIACPATAEYTCPVCGEKTVYSYSQSAFIEWELQGCRRLVESINSTTEFPVELDETLFCEFCTPENREEDPWLVLVVTPEEGLPVTNRVTIEDLRMLDSFLQGNLYYSTSNDGEIPLREYAGRMRELLGLKEE